MVVILDQSVRSQRFGVFGYHLHPESVSYIDMSNKRYQAENLPKLCNEIKKKKMQKNKAMFCSYFVKTAQRKINYIV